MADRRQARAEAPAGPHGVLTGADLVEALEILRRRAARGSGRAKVSLDELSARTGIPRSTVHSYLQGVRLPPADSLDALVVALGADGGEQRAWAQALERVARSSTATRSGRRPPNLLPMPPHGFHGRVAELTRLRELTATVRESPGEAPVVVRLSGTGGIGKSALALHFAHQVADAFPDGVLWVDLHGFGPHRPVQPADVLTRFLTALGAGGPDLPDDLETRVALYRSAVAGRRMLVVLDNAGSIDTVRALLPASSGCLTLVTSRSDLAALGLAESTARIEVGRLSDADALALLEPGGGPRSSDEVRDAAGAPDGRADLVRFCDGLPLALRIVRERLQSGDGWTVAALHTELSDRARRLTALRLPGNEETLGVQSVIESSYRQLPSSAAALLRRLTLARTPAVTLTLAVAVDGRPPVGVRQDLQRLAADHLIELVGPERYHLHDLIAAFAQARLAEDSPADLAVATRRAIEAFDRLVDPPSSGGTVSPGGTVLSGDDLAELLPVVVGLAESADELGVPEAAWAMLAHTFFAALYRIDVAVLEPALRRAAEQARARGNPAQESRLRRILGVRAAITGHPEAARTQFEQAQLLARRAGDEQQELDVLGNLARLETRQGNLAEALRLRTEERRRRAALGGPPSLVMLAGMADLLLQIGDLDASGRVRQELLAAAREQGDVAMVSVAHYHLGGLALSQDDLARAAQEAEACRCTAQRSGVGFCVLNAAVLDAVVSLARGEADTAARQVRAALDVPAGDESPETVDAWVAHGRIALHRGAAAEALASHRRAVAVARDMGLRFQETIALLSLARTMHTLDDPGEALSTARTAQRLAGACGFARLADHARKLMNDASVDVSRR